MTTPTHTGVSERPTTPLRRGTVTSGEYPQGESAAKSIVAEEPAGRSETHRAESDETLSEEGGVNESSSGVHGQQMSPLGRERNLGRSRTASSTSPPAERVSSETHRAERGGREGAAMMSAAEGLRALIEREDDSALWWVAPDILAVVEAAEGHVEPSISHGRHEHDSLRTALASLASRLSDAAAEGERT